MTRSMSSKSQLNIDLIVSYLLFIFFVAFLFQFILNLFTPFNNNIQAGREKQIGAIMMEKLEKEWDIDNIEEVCFFSNEQVESIKSEFYIEGFPIPDYDLCFNPPNQSEGGVVFYRQGNKIRIIAGAEEEKNISLILVFPERLHIAINPKNNESNDNIELSTDRFGNNVLDAIFRVNQTDYDEIDISTSGEGMVFLESIRGIDKGNVFIGDTPLKTGCGNDKGGYSSIVEGFTTIKNHQQRFPARYKMKIWWFE